MLILQLLGGRRCNLNEFIKVHKSIHFLERKFTRNTLVMLKNTHTHNVFCHFLFKIS